ncbi:hypothetical protein X566_15050 [Afipia sp. P52-10]|nr:hypothetical protein X566_15050 [Afipia sp. P52-10]
MKLSAVVFAALWMVPMWLVGGRSDLAALVIVVLCGAVVGALWYWLYGKWCRWYIDRP